MNSDTDQTEPENVSGRPRGLVSVFWAIDIEEGVIWVLCKLGH